MLSLINLFLLYFHLVNLQEKDDLKKNSVELQKEVVLFFNPVLVTIDLMSLDNNCSFFHPYWATSISISYFPLNQAHCWTAFFCSQYQTRAFFALFFFIIIVPAFGMISKVFHAVRALPGVFDYANKIPHSLYCRMYSVCVFLLK